LRLQRITCGMTSRTPMTSAAGKAKASKDCIPSCTNQEVKAGSGGEEKAFEEMDEKIDTFMKKHEWAFPMGKGDTLTGKAKLDWGCERVHGLFDDNFLYCGGMMRADK
jgi:hypothetical protein